MGGIIIALSGIYQYCTSARIICKRVDSHTLLAAAAGNRVQNKRPIFRLATQTAEFTPGEITGEKSISATKICKVCFSSYIVSQINSNRSKTTQKINKNHTYRL